MALWFFCALNWVSFVPLIVSFAPYGFFCALKVPCEPLNGAKHSPPAWRQPDAVFPWLVSKLNLQLFFSFPTKSFLLPIGIGLVFSPQLIFSNLVLFAF